MNLVKFDGKNDQKTQVYEEKLNLIRDPIVRYRFIFGPFAVRQRFVFGPFAVRFRSVRGPFAVRQRSVNGTSGFFEVGVKSGGRVLLNTCLPYSNRICDGFAGPVI
jgi:hypothetical protein